MMQQHTHSQQRQRYIDALAHIPKEDFLARLMVQGKLALLDKLEGRK